MDDFVRCPQCDDDLPGDDWEQHLGTHGYFKRPDAAPPKEVLQGIEEAAKGEGRHINDDELEVMPDGQAVDSAGKHSTDVNGAPSEPPPSAAEALARRFHEEYERLAPQFGYKTREASAVPWEDVPESNRRLMVAVAEKMLPLLAPVAWRWRRTDLPREPESRRWVYWYPGDPAHHDPRRFIGERDDIAVEAVYTHTALAAAQPDTMTPKEGTMKTERLREVLEKLLRDSDETDDWGNPGRDDDAEFLAPIIEKMLTVDKGMNYDYTVVRDWIDGLMEDDCERIAAASAEGIRLLLHQANERLLPPGGMTC